MPQIADILLLVLLTATSILLCTRALRVMRAVSKRKLLAESFRSTVDAADGPGISILCGRVDRRRLENLLGTEYPRCEVVVTMDANYDHAAFRTIVERFRMARVTRSLSHEIPAVGIRALYRSQDRRFRRLILIDKLSTTESDDRNAAACYASFDHLLPLPDGCMLLDDAVERLVVAVCEYEADEVAVIRTDVGPATALYRREDVVAAGGFGSASLGRVPHRRTRTLHEPLVWCPVRSASLLAGGLGLSPDAGPCDSLSSRRAIAWGIRASVAAATLAVLVFAAWRGWWALLAALFTVLLAWSVACYVALVAGGAPRQMLLEEEESEVTD